MGMMMKGDDDLSMDDGFEFLEEHMGSILHRTDFLLAGILGFTPLDHVVEAFVEFRQRAWIVGEVKV